jgi:ABC-type sugar transport system ATPase subunit
LYECPRSGQRERDGRGAGADARGVPDGQGVASHLDALNEAALRETVAETGRMTTVLVVAHRLSTVTMADRIIVIDAGLVKAVGTHAELVTSDPLYAELAATQFLASAEAGIPGVP